MRISAAAAAVKSNDCRVITKSQTTPERHVNLRPTARCVCVWGGGGGVGHGGFTAQFMS